MPPLPLLVFVVGTGSLGAEIAAVRLLAPYFGASTIVWANTIGVVLVALSIGYWLGGRWADRNPTHARPVPGRAGRGRAARRSCRSRPTRCSTSRVDALDEISAGAFVGSLIAVLVLVAMPVLLLGAVVAVGAAARGRHVSRTPGRSPGACTRSRPRAACSARSLSALLLIPLVGTRRTFLVFALAIAVVAVWGLRPVRRYALAPVAIAVLIALPVGTLKASDDGRGDLRGRDRVPVRARRRARRRQRARSS